MWTYTALALLYAAAWALIRLNPVSWTYAVFAAMAVGIFVFGGQGQRGLIKNFLNRPPRHPHEVNDLIRMELVSGRPAEKVSMLWNNDERELARRDRAHYIAYQPLAIGMIALLLLSAWALHPPRFASQAVLLQMAFGTSLLGAMVSVTLPAAIILWSEPDIDPEGSELGSGEAA